MVFTPEYIKYTLDDPDTLLQAWEKINSNMLAIKDELTSMESEIAVLESEIP